MKAIKPTGNGTAVLVHDAPIPPLKPDHLLIKVYAVAFNPTDYSHVHGMSPPNSTVGCDFAGEIVEIGERVREPFALGDRVFGFVNGASSDLDSGAFVEYLVSLQSLFGGDEC